MLFRSRAILQPPPPIMAPPAMEVHHRAAPCCPRASFSVDRAHHRQVTALFPPSAALFECPRGPAPPSSSHGRLHPRVTSRTPSSRACAPVAPVQELHEERSSSSSPQEAAAPERSSPRQRCIARGPAPLVGSGLIPSSPPGISL